MTNQSSAAGQAVYVMLEELLNGERIPMGVPGDEEDVLESYGAFAYLTEDAAKAEKAGLVAFNSDYQSSVTIVPGLLSANGDLSVEGRVWTREQILAEHGVAAPTP